MDTTIFIELDEKLQNTDMALDELLKMNLSKEAKDALNMIIENLTQGIGLLNQIRINYEQLDMKNKKLTQAFQGAKNQLKDIDIELEG